MSHLYVDDIIILCEASIEWLMCLNWTLMLFEAIFGLKVNFEKI